MRRLLYFLLVVGVAYSTLFPMVPQTATITADTIYERLRWIENSNPTFIVGTEGTDTVTVKIRLTQLYNTVFNLRGEVLSKNSLGIFVDPPSVTNTSDGTYTWITIRYTYNQLLTSGDTYGCVNSGSAGNYAKYLCVSQVNFWGTEVSRKLRQINYNFVVMVNKYVTGEVIASAQEEVITGPDVNITTAVTAAFKIYKPDCATEIPGNILTYRENYCLKMESTNSIGNNYFFKPYSFGMTYRYQDGTDQLLDILSRATCTYGPSNTQKGIVLCKFQLATVSTPMKFILTVSLKDSAIARLMQVSESLLDKRVQLTSNEFVVSSIPGTSAGIMTTVSVILLAILAVFLI
jgi:hypothetical protein